MCRVCADVSITLYQLQIPVSRAPPLANDGLQIPEHNRGRYLCFHNRDAKTQKNCLFQGWYVLLLEDLIIIRCCVCDLSLLKMDL